MIEIKINADNAADLKRDLVTLLDLVGGTTPVAETKAETKKAKSSKKQKAVEEVPPQEEPASEEESAEEAEITVRVLRAKAKEKMDDDPSVRKAIRDLIKKYDAKNVVDIPKDKRADFLKELEAL